MRNCRLIPWALLAAAVACGPAAAQSLFRGDDAIIANEGKIGDKWMLADGATLTMPTYPPAMASTGSDVCMALGYRINPDGTTSDFAVLKQWNSEKGADEPVDGYWQAFADAGAHALQQWRFKPRPEVKSARPTYTVATLAFTGGKGKGGDIGGNCRISDLAALMQKQKSRAYMNNSRDRAELDRANQAARSRNSMTSNPTFPGTHPGR